MSIDDEDEDTPPGTPEPRSSPRPAYDARRPMRTRETGEISLEELKRDLRDRAKSYPWKAILTALGLLVPGGGMGAFAYRHSDDDESAQRQMREQAREIRELREKVQQAQIDVARCCR